MPVTWGLLSTAGINDKLLAGARGSEQVEVIAVASRDRERAVEYARRNGIARAHGSYEALLADDVVEAVYIPLPNSLHVEWAIAALEAGKHVLVEKPLDRRPEEVARAFDAAERAGRVLSEAFMWRHSPQTARLVELLASGAIGRLAHLRSTFSFRLPPERAGDIRLSRELHGGALMDVGCYCVSGIRLLAGEPVAVHAEQETGPSGVDVRLAALMRMPGDVTASFDCALTVTPRDELEAIGDEGSLFLDDPFHGRRPGIELRRGDEVERIEAPFADPYRLELENVSGAIRGTAPLLLGREDAMGQATVIAALYASAERNALSAG